MPPDQGEGITGDESLARTQLDPKMHAIGKGRKPGEKGAKEERGDKGDHPRKEVVVTSMKRSPDGNQWKELNNIR